MPDPSPQGAPQSALPNAPHPAPAQKAAAATRPALPGIGAVRWYQRLYLRIFLAMLIGLITAALLSAAVVRLSSDSEQVRQSMMVLNEFVSEALPPASRSAAEQRVPLLRWQQRLKINLSLYDRSGKLITSAGNSVLPLPPATQQGGSVYVDHSVLALKLDDGRWLVARESARPYRTVFSLGWALLLMLLVIALIAYPVVRHLTRRLERLQQTVVNFGSGQLASRIRVEGRDEIASLATSFNQAAQRIETLVASQKNLLANASHELRSPLARIRMAVELLDTGEQAAMGDELRQNIHELDQLIDEILLSSRLDASTTAPERHETDLTALLAEECTHHGASLDAPALLLRCDAKLLRRLIRNLLENAGRYGNGKPIELSARSNGKTLQLDVCDRGPGIPEAQRDTIFDAFYRLPGASETAGGVGLGLYLVRQIARQHGGDVNCLPRAGGGSCFRVELPLE
jgi:signal transduction histidine kinase